MTRIRDLRNMGLYDPDPEVRAKAEKQLAKEAKGGSDEPLEIGVTDVTLEEATKQVAAEEKAAAKASK